MSRAKVVVLSRRMIVSLMAMLLWIASLTGLFSLLTESYVLGAFWLALAIALFIGLIQGSLMFRLEGRQVPVPSVVLVLGILLLVGVTQLINLLMTRPSMTTLYLFDVAYSLGILILGEYAARQILRSTGDRSKGH